MRGRSFSHALPLMPISPIRSERPGGSFDPGPGDGWIMPLGTFGGIRFSLSYSVLVALAVLAGVVAMVQHRPGDQDLPLIALIAVLIWSVGWVVQLIVQVWLHLGTPARSESITIGLVGVELGNPLYRLHAWSAKWILTSAIISYFALILFGLACLSIHMYSHAGDASLVSTAAMDPAVAQVGPKSNITDPGSLASWMGQVSKKSFGLDEVHNCYLAAFWLLCFQATCQAFPLPHHLGRGALAAMAAVFAPGAPDSLRVWYVRRALFLIVGITISLAVVTVVTDSDFAFPRWPILLFLAFLLWASTRNRDLEDWVASIRVAAMDPAKSWLETGDLEEADELEDSEADDDLEDEGESSRSTRRGWLADIFDSVRLHRRRRKARAAWQREQDEARDEAKLDQLLERIAQHGTESLSGEEKALLERVSERTRRDRATKPDSDSP